VGGQATGLTGRTGAFLGMLSTR